MFGQLLPILIWHSNSTDLLGLIEDLLFLYLSVGFPSTKYYSLPSSPQIMIPEVLLHKIPTCNLHLRVCFLRKPTYNNDLVL